MKHSRIARVLKYIYMPILFCVIGYLILGVVLEPVWKTASGAVSILAADSAPKFDSVVKQTYDPGPREEQPAQLRVETTEDDQEHTYIHIEDVKFPLAGEQYGTLVCDRIALDVPVFWDDTNEILRYGAGQFLASYLPGFGRMILLSGHNNTFFAPLQDIQKGDVLDFHTAYCDYQYEVTETKVYDENELNDFILGNLLNEEEILVMYTCYPFKITVGRKTDRWTVIAKRISGYDVKWRDLDE